MTFNVIAVEMSRSPRCTSPARWSPLTGRSEILTSGEELCAAVKPHDPYKLRWPAGYNLHKLSCSSDPIRLDFYVGAYRTIFLHQFLLVGALYLSKHAERGPDYSTNLRCPHMDTVELKWEELFFWHHFWANRNDVVMPTRWERFLAKRMVWRLLVFRFVRSTHAQWSEYLDWLEKSACRDLDGIFYKSANNAGKLLVDDRLDVNQPRLTPVRACEQMFSEPEQRESILWTVKNWDIYAEEIMREKPVSESEVVNDARRVDECDNKKLEQLHRPIMAKLREQLRERSAAFNSSQWRTCAVGGLWSADEAKAAPLKQLKMDNEKSGKVFTDLDAEEKKRVINGLDLDQLQDMNAVGQSMNAAKLINKKRKKERDELAKQLGIPINDLLRNYVVPRAQELKRDTADEDMPLNNPAGIKAQSEKTSVLACADPLNHPQRPDESQGFIAPHSPFPESLPAPPCGRSSGAYQEERIPSHNTDIQHAERRKVMNCGCIPFVRSSAQNFHRVASTHIHENVAKHPVNHSTFTNGFSRSSVKQSRAESEAFARRQRPHPSACNATGSEPAPRIGGIQNPSAQMAQVVPQQHGRANDSVFAVEMAKRKLGLFPRTPNTMQQETIFSSPVVNVTVNGLVAHSGSGVTSNYKGRLTPNSVGYLRESTYAVRKSAAVPKKRAARSGPNSQAQQRKAKRDKPRYEHEPSDSEYRPSSESEKTPKAMDSKPETRRMTKRQETLAAKHNAEMEWARRMHEQAQFLAAEKAEKRARSKAQSQAQWKFPQKMSRTATKSTAVGSSPETVKGIPYGVRTSHQPR